MPRCKSDIPFLPDPAQNLDTVFALRVIGGKLIQRIKRTFARIAQESVSNRLLDEARAFRRRNDILKLRLQSLGNRESSSFLVIVHGSAPCLCA